MGQLNKGKTQMVFDWDKAAQIIRDRKPEEAYAGLSGDWEWTGGVIYNDGKPVPQEDTYVYLSSTWATPQLEIDDEVIDCFVMKTQDVDWDSDTYWPESALAILNASDD
jgi:hypothetical protein